MIDGLKLKFYFRTEVAADAVAMYLVGEDVNGRKWIAQPQELAFKELDRGMIQKPTWEIAGFVSRGFLEALANGLAEAGYRHESNDAGELKATKLHLGDMQEFAKKLLDSTVGVPVQIRQNLKFREELRHLEEEEP